MTFLVVFEHATYLNHTVLEMNKKQNHLHKNFQLFIYLLTALISISECSNNNAVNQFQIQIWRRRGLSKNVRFL